MQWLYIQFCCMLGKFKHSIYVCFVLSIAVVQLIYESEAESSSCVVRGNVRRKKKANYKEVKEPNAIGSSELLDFLEIPHTSWQISE